MDDQTRLNIELIQLSEAVRYFAHIMEQKLHDKARAGFRGWNNIHELPHLRSILADHVYRGDDQMVDVANIAMIIYWNTHKPE